MPRSLCSRGIAYALPPAGGGLNRSCVQAKIWLISRSFPATYRDSKRPNRARPVFRPTAAFAGRGGRVLVGAPGGGWLLAAGPERARHAPATRPASVYVRLAVRHAMSLVRHDHLVGPCGAWELDRGAGVEFGRGLAGRRGGAGGALAGGFGRPRALADTAAQRARVGGRLPGGGRGDVDRLDLPAELRPIVSFKRNEEIPCTGLIRGRAATCWPLWRPAVSCRRKAVVGPC